MGGKPYSVLCQCNNCRAQFELMGNWENGTLNLDRDPRITASNGKLYDHYCGGTIEIFSCDAADIKVTYPETKRPRGRPKKIQPIFSLKT